MTGIQAVVFDIGNVLIEWQPERYYDRKIGETRRREMFDAVDLHGMNDKVDRGEPFKETIYATAETYPEWHNEIRDWHDNWIELAQPVIEHSVVLLRALRTNDVPVFALSNFGIESFAYAETVYAFLGEFDRRYISGHMGVIKPDAAIYAALEADSGIAPDRLLFADDRIDNINAAKNRGWRTHHFEGAAAFAGLLVREGLLTGDDATL